MKKLFFAFVILLAAASYGQVSGDIYHDSRAITNDINYTFIYSKEGKMVFTIAVNNAGKVTGCEIDKAKSTIVSTPQMIKAKNLILTQLSFVAGNGYPTFHQGVVTINFKVQ